MTTTLESHPAGPLQSPSQSAAIDWLWNYFLHLREDIYYSVVAAGARLPDHPFSFEEDENELARLLPQTPELKEADVGLLRQTLHELDDAFEAFLEGKADLPHEH